jgi:hypothetical protein
MSNEDFGRITRILNDGTDVTLEFNIVNRVFPEGATSYNTIAEIRGGDKADEVIMLGGHLDSWHAATGATDNAIGCAIMMEAARILKTLGVKPRRTLCGVVKSRACWVRLPTSNNTSERLKTRKPVMKSLAATSISTPAPGVCVAHRSLDHRKPQTSCARF